MASSTASASRQKKITWTNHNTHVFLEIFVSQQEEENWKETLLTKEAKERLVSKFYQRTGYDLKWKNFKNHYDNLKTWYDCYKRLCKKTGVALNPITGAIEMEKEWWDDRIKENPTANHIYKKPLQDLNILEKIFAEILIGTSDGWVVGNGPDHLPISDSSTGTQPTANADVEPENVLPNSLSTQQPNSRDLTSKRKRKAPDNNEKDDFSAAYDRRSENIRLAGETFGSSDRERALRRIHQVSHIEYNSSFYWEIIDLIQNNETTSQMILGFSEDKHIFNYLHRLIEARKETHLQSDFNFFE